MQWNIGANRGYDVDDYAATGAPGAAIYVAVMVATAAIFLTVLKKSGFKAMVAVGRGG